ncbi:CRISPR-associated endonuclease Cas6 [Thiocystis violascens]|uniref:DNA repair protein n=1 Tax=Thiocystis violascens (strain ATCC 17096 / DSM 198 / 6111) TaxID=765911 RepID=I3YH44_THIV6|nr:CRISPR-associated endonuclease Cas6 [Thiocystis violascens]AFL76312.1 hypothetical protein Thivi_4516 [Thiocystis violascens DSM 198]
MHPLAQIPLAQVELHWDRALSGGGETRTRQLRGALATAFREDDLFHQHDPLTGKSLYRYPKVQYRWHDGHGLILGWGDAASRLLGLPWLDLALRLGEDTVSVTDAALTLTHGQFAIGDRLAYYRIQTPVLLFNQDNYRRYRTLAERERRDERDRLLIAHLLTALRGLDIEFKGQLYAVFTQSIGHTCHYKGESLLGLRGEFVTNAILPVGFAFGHAVSHGYGEVIAMPGAPRKQEPAKSSRQSLAN